MKITILYDNEAYDPRLKGDWGFAALLETDGRKILFDTGAKADLLFENMEILNISVDAIDEIFISHDHWDHTGGLKEMLKKKSVPVYVPDTMDGLLPAENQVVISGPEKIHEHIFSTGTLMKMEQSICLEKDGKIVVVAGCSHPGVDAILSAASQIGTVKALVGGLHGFNDFKLLEPLETICATHCTQHKKEIEKLFPASSIVGGAGRIIEF
jgi:7,8-dihydropterin-6-yl-methyl-4-(beta-D-ribofuranosyl)aminobenzene 5'-phosphate synthase